MNWIQQNKFLAGYFAVIIVAVGVLGYLLFSAKGSYDEAAAAYQTQATELDRLQHLAPFPDEENLKKLQAQKKEHQEKVQELQTTLGKAKFPVEPMTPEQFQDVLHTAVSDYTKKAADNGVEIAAKPFYLGFDTYQSVPPKPEAAPLLGRELKAIQIVMNSVLSHGASSIKFLKRDPLPEEGGAAASQSQQKGGNRPGAGGAGEKNLVSKHSFEVTFLAPKGRPQSVLNDIVESKTQFLIPRLVIVKNEKDKGPSREAPPEAPQPPTTGTPQPPGTPPAAADPAHTFIVGDEKVETTLIVDIADIADLPAKQTSAK